MLYGIAAIIGIALIGLILLLAYFYEKIVIPSVCFATAIFFIYVSIAAEVYFMFIIPAFCVFYGIIYIKDNPIHRKKKDKK